MFQSLKNILGRDETRADQINKLEAEADQFKLPSETLPQIFKFLFFAGLAFLNYRLFAHTVPGAWGIMTGIVAMMAEALAVYCSHYFSRAAGLFRASLGICGALLMGFSLVHGTFSILDLIGVWEYSDTIAEYSRIVAFPLLAALIGLTVVALTMTHPNNIIRMREALAHTRIARDRAEAASDVRIMRNRSIVESARLEFRKEQTRLEAEHLQNLTDYVGIKQKTRQLIQSIPDPVMREALAREAGMTDPGAEDPPKNKPGFTNNSARPAGPLD
jgi:hypothetical protein